MTAESLSINAQRSPSPSVGAIERSPTNYKKEPDENTEPKAGPAPSGPSTLERCPRAAERDRRGPGRTRPPACADQDGRPGCGRATHTRCHRHRSNSGAERTRLV